MPGILDCPAFDAWIAALLARGYVTGELEPNLVPTGPRVAKRWRLNDRGRAEAGRCSADRSRNACDACAPCSNS